MKILFINACVREGSRTLSLCKKYLSRYSDDEIREVVLNDSGLQPLNANTLEQRNWDLKNGDLSSAEYDLAREFAKADEIVIGAPYWDFSFPAILKTYFEHICVNKITFGYEHGIPTGYCKAEKMTYITTAGGYISSANSLEIYLDELRNLFGIPELQFVKAEGLDIDGNDVQKIMREAMERLTNK